MCQTVCISLEQKLGLCFVTDYCLNDHFFSCLNVFPSFLHSFTSLISNSFVPALWNSGRYRKLKAFSANKKQATKRGFYTQESPAGSCSVSISPFLWYSSVLKGTRVNKKWNKVLNREINHKLSRGTLF